MKKFTRSEFFKMMITSFILVGFGKLMVACSDSKDDSNGDDGGNGGGPAPQPDCLNAGTKVAISGHLGHQLTVTKADVTAGIEETYNITGSAGHTHFVTITAADFTNLAANQQITITSTGGPHTHNVTVSCALA